MNRQFPLYGLLAAAFAGLVGCGGGNSTATQAGTFTIAVAPSAVTVTPGGPPQQLTLTAAAQNGFSGTVGVTVGGLPAGVTATPSTLSLTPGTLQQVTISAANNAASGNSVISVSGTSGSLSQSATAALHVANAPQPVTTASLSATSFDFGDNLVANVLSKSVVDVVNTGSAVLSLNPTLSGDSSYAIVAAQSCGTQLAPGSTCPVVVTYAPASASAPAQQKATLNLGFGDVPDGTPGTVSITGRSAVLAQGQVTTTNNPQVALYTINTPFDATVTIQFGTDTSYGHKTWTRTSPAGGGPVSVYVAGMLANSSYHMQATVDFLNGVTATDVDHTFSTGSIPASLNLNFTAATTPGSTPQPGVELLNPVFGATAGLLVSDLAGHVIWTYSNPGDPSVQFINGVKFLPNGDVLMVIGPGSSRPLAGALPPGTITSIREVNLAGDTVREIELSDLNARLAASGSSLTLTNFHHDVTALPNGHILALANTIKAFTNLPGYPGTTNVLGDVIVDLNENLQPVWIWNEFDHLDVNRHPYQFPDWTHTNALVYSPDDGNILVSIRHQSWVVKVEYLDGKGSGNIIWKLGEGGDFALEGATDPTDWFYAQHAPAFTSSNSTGAFNLTLMDNGDDRQFASGQQCGTSGQPVCLYSTIPILQLNESARTASFQTHQILPANLYSFFGGNSELLANGNLEYDLAGVGTDSDVFETTPESTPQTVWHLHATGTNLYRAFRIPSLYPGVQW